MNYLQISNYANDADQQARARIALHSVARSYVNNPPVANAAASLAWANSLRKTGTTGIPLSTLLVLVVSSTPGILAHVAVDGSLDAGSTEDDYATALQSAVDAVVADDIVVYEFD